MRYCLLNPEPIVVLIQGSLVQHAACDTRMHQIDRVQSMTSMPQKYLFPTMVVICRGFA